MWSVECIFSGIYSGFRYMCGRTRQICIYIYIGRQNLSTSAWNVFSFRIQQRSAQTDTIRLVYYTLCLIYSTSVWSSSNVRLDANQHEIRSHRWLDSVGQPLVCCGNQRHNWVLIKSWKLEIWIYLFEFWLQLDTLVSTFGVVEQFSVWIIFWCVTLVSAHAIRVEVGTRLSAS